ncbi:MAG TPA: AraC family transcriptional regulator [Polyangiaceae bacterium]|nr:AraC family transcriptional regulator [Polyangiaceae bacterium]
MRSPSERDDNLNTAADAYRARFRRVLDHIDAQLDAPLSVEDLGAVAAFSKYHFHRQFSAWIGMSVFRYVQLLRLKRASYQLAFREQSRILDIALECGYESNEAFSRAFKRAFALTPSEFRERPDWEAWRATYEALKEIRSLHMRPELRAGDVRLVDFQETRVAALEHRGDPATIEDSIRRFIEWRRQNRLHPKLSATFNVFWDSPSDTAPERFRMDLCAAITGSIPENSHGVVPKTIPGGRCAVLRHVGSEDTLPESISFLYSQWLPSSGEELRDFPLYLQRVTFFPDVPEHEAITDIFLPVR